MQRSRRRRISDGHQRRRPVHDGHEPRHVRELQRSRSRRRRKSLCFGNDPEVPLDIVAEALCDEPNVVEVVVNASKVVAALLDATPAQLGEVVQQRGVRAVDKAEIREGLARVLLEPYPTRAVNGFLSPAQHWSHGEPHDNRIRVDLELPRNWPLGNMPAKRFERARQMFLNGSAVRHELVGLVEELVSGISKSAINELRLPRHELLSAVEELELRACALLEKRRQELVECRHGESGTRVWTTVLERSMTVYDR